MYFNGVYEVTVDSNGEFLLPDYYQSNLEPGAKYGVFYSLDEWEIGSHYLNILLYEAEKFFDEKCIYNGYVTEDMKVKLPENVISFMEGDCELICDSDVLWLSKLPIDMLIEALEFGLKLELDLL